MVQGLDMSLDDLINKNKKPRIGKNSNSSSPLAPLRRRRRDSAASPAPTRRPYKPRQTITTPYTSSDEQLSTGFPDFRPAEPEPEGSLYVSNLRSTVSNNDIKVLFSALGELKRYGIHYDSEGRSQGTAEVVFVRKPDAIVALKLFNKSPLDGKILTIELIGPESTRPPMLPLITDWEVAPPIPPFVAPFQMARFTPQNVPQWQMPLMPQTDPQWMRPGKATPNYGFRDDEWHHEGRGRVFGQGRIPQDKRLGKVSTEDLDADLEKYLSKRKNNS